MTNVELLEALDELKSTMISVATGGDRIQVVEAQFSAKFDQVDAELTDRGIENTLPYRDLWQWYARWASGDMPSWASRRAFVSELFAPLVKAVQAGCYSPFAATGWPRVDRTVTEVRARLASANTEEHFQAVGLLCREALISIAQAVYNEDLHATLDGVKASSTDAKRMLEAYVGHNLAGSANEYTRKHTRSALDLAVHLQHRRTATFRDAALCVEATTSLVNLVAILSGRRDPGLAAASRADLRHRSLDLRLAEHPAPPDVRQQASRSLPAHAAGREP